MKTVALLLIALAILAFAVPGRAQPATGTASKDAIPEANPKAAVKMVQALHMRNAPVDLVIEVVRPWTGRSVLILEDLKGTVTLNIEEPMPRDDALKLIVKSLREQAHVELVELPNHVLYFRPLSSTGEVATSSTTISKGGIPQFFPGTAVARPDMKNSFVKEWRTADYPEPIECILNHVELVTGRKISADPAVLALSGPEHGMFLFRVSFRVVSFEMALRLYRSGLKEQLGVILDDLPDGSLHARLVAPPASPGDVPKPNS